MYTHDVTGGTCTLTLMMEVGARAMAVGAIMGDPTMWLGSSIGWRTTNILCRRRLPQGPGIDATTQHNHLLVFVRYAVSRLTTAVVRPWLSPSCDDPSIYLSTFRLHKRKMSADFLAADYDNSSADATLRMLLPLAAAFTTIAADGFPRPHTHLLLSVGQRPLYAALPTSVTDRLVQLPPVTGHCFHTCGCKVH